PGLQRAAIGVVEHAVVVIVGVRAAVAVLEAVDVLGRARALIDAVGNAVLVVVAIRAALERRDPRLVRAAVDLVGHAVTVGVAAVIRMGLVRLVLCVAATAAAVQPHCDQ